MAVPKLRFKEFSGDWEYKRAKDLFINSSNKKHNGDLPILAVTQDKGVVYREDLDLKIHSSDKGVKNYKIVNKGDFVISLRSFQGGIEFSSLEGICSPAYTIIKTLSEVNPSLYQYYLKRERFIRRLNYAIVGIRDGKQISYSLFSEMKIPYTTYKEQTKIADFLTILDKQITLQQKKLDLLKQYKKGMMQKLFSREIRFKDDDGSEFPEWEEKRISDFGKVITGSTPTTRNKEFYGGQYLFISPIDISENRYVRKTKTTLTEKGFDRCRHLPKGSIHFVCIGSTIGKIAQSIKQSTTNQQINSIISNDNNCADFIYFYLSNISSKIKRLAGEQAVPLINKTDFCRIKTFIPRKNEQTQIANLLSSIDKKIEIQDIKVSNLQQFKKGLLQKMFI